MTPKLPLPRGWKRHVRSSVLHILALSHYTFTVPSVERQGKHVQVEELPTVVPAAENQAALRSSGQA